MGSDWPDSSSNEEGKWAVPCPEFPNVITSPFIIQPTSTVLTLPQLLKQNLHKWEDAVAFECGLNGRKYTHGEIFAKSKRFAASLTLRGLTRGDVGCILLPNVPEYPIVALGIWEVGLVLSPINPSYTPNEVAKQINDCQGKVIVTLPDLLPTVQAVKLACPSLRSIIVIGEGTEGCLSFLEMVETAPLDSLPTDSLPSDSLPSEEDLNVSTETAILPYSSGTTGPPKGVELTQANISALLQQAMHPGYKKIRFFETGAPQERFIAILPFFHVYGLQVVMCMTLLQGAHTICLPRFDPRTFVKAVKNHRPTLLHLVPPLISFINNCSEISEEDLKETHSVSAGAAPIGRSLIDGLLSKAGPGTLFLEGYGMTETALISITPYQTKNTKIGSCGVLVAETTCKIIDLNSGETVGPCQTGEICIRGPQVMKGYYNNEQATIEAIDSEGFLRTGDIGYYDEDGFLYIVDRLKELIKVKGLQVAPAELENVLRQHPEIGDVAVIGIKHDTLGEAPRAYVVRKTKTLTESSVSDFLEGKVASHKKLIGGVEFIDSVPKSPAGKIIRRVLLQDYQSKLPKPPK